jgi:hypothetical protein
MKELLKKIKRQIVPDLRMNDFIEIDESGFWRRRSHQGKSLAYAANEFNRLGGKLIVEIGSGVHGPMAGNSIIAWATRTSAERILAVDLDPKRIEEVRAATSRYASVEPLLADGREVVRELSATIDLLYLDFWTPDEDASMLPGTSRADSYLELYELAREKLNKRSLILIDDTDHIDPWKQTRILPAARADGFSVVYVGRQTLMRRE